MIPYAFIDEVDLHEEYGLYVKSRSVPLPEPKLSFVDVPGGNGALDLSTVLTDGDTKFNLREVSVTFTSTGDYNAARDALARLTHGRVVRLSFSDDREHYLRGRAWVSEWSYDASGIPEVTVTIHADPYRYLTDVTRIDFVADGSTLVIPNRRMWTTATFTADRRVDVIFGGVSYALTAGVPRKLPGVILREGETHVQFSGAANVRVEYQEGVL